MRNEDGDWTLRASGRLRAWSGAEPKLKPWTPEIEPPAHFERTRFYRELRQEGHEFGPAFQGVETIWRERGQVLGRIGLPQAAGSGSEYLLHPSVLDSCFQVIRGFRDFDGKEEHSHTLALPIAIKRLRFFRKPGPAVYSRAVAVEEDDGENIVADISIIDEAGRLVALIEGFTCRQVIQPAQQQAASGPAHYREQWIELPALEPAEAERPAGGMWLILADRAGVGCGAGGAPRRARHQDGSGFRRRANSVSPAMQTLRMRSRCGQLRESCWKPCRRRACRGSCICGRLMERTPRFPPNGSSKRRSLAPRR